MEVVVTTQAHHLNEVGGGLFEPTASKACVSNMLKLHEVVVPYKPTTSKIILGGGLLWPTI